MTMDRLFEIRIGFRGTATKPCDEKLAQYDPCWRMVAGAFLAAYLAIDARLDEAPRELRAEQEMIEP